jgi:hypothetical protein
VTANDVVSLKADDLLNGITLQRNGRANLHVVSLKADDLLNGIPPLTAELVHFVVDFQRHPAGIVNGTWVCRRTAKHDNHTPGMRFAILSTIL